MRRKAVAGVSAVALVAALFTVATPAGAQYGDGDGDGTASCAEADHPGGDWTMMGEDLGHSRHQEAEDQIGPAEAATLTPAWTFDANAASGVSNTEITGYPIVADGCAYVGSHTGNQMPGFVFAMNAETGELVWKTQIDHGVYSTLAVADGRVYAFASRVVSDRINETSGGPDCDPPDEGDPDGIETVCGPYLVALDQQTGDILWQTTVDFQEGSDAVSSPIVFDGMVWVGISGTAAEGEEAERFEFRGASVLVDAETGELLEHTWTVPDEDFAEGFSGGALWSTIGVNPETKYGFVGSGNPFSTDKEHRNTNAILKVDLDRSRETFGEIVGSYKGDIEEFFPELSGVVPCEQFEDIFAAGFECARLDLDFGAAPQIFEIDGETVVGEGQKSGVYHVVDPDTMDQDPETNEFVWKQVVGVPSLVGGIVGTPAHDGENLYIPHTLGGYLASLEDQEGAHRWFAPTHDGIHWGNPVTSANGVIYTPGLDGFLNAYDAATGAQLLKRPIVTPETGTDPPFTWGGATVARNTVYTSVGVGLSSVGPENPPENPWMRMPNGFVVAFRPASEVVSGGM